MLETAWITWEGNGARAGRGPPGLVACAGNGPDRPGGLLRHPSGTRTGAPFEAEKAWNGDLRRRVGAPVRRDFTMQRQAGAPSPLVPSRIVVRAADRAWATSLEASCN